MTTALRSVLRFGLTAAATAAFLSAGIAAPAHAATDPALPPNDARLQEISERYEVGEELSPEDERFIKSIGTPVAAPGTRGAAANCFNTVRTGGVNGRGRAQGCHGSVIGNGITNSWRTGYTATGNSQVRKLRAAEHIRAYGLVGSGGFGVVYSRDVSSGILNTRSHQFSRSATFKALAAYVTVQYDATFWTSRGSFSVVGG
ncbi:MAG: hypothetical protein DI639_02390 [Leifsonia xyli]|nr:MAG: hypothetical protein DI639_02390 [Leifsonia xyli]